MRITSIEEHFSYNKALRTIDRSWTVRLHKWVLNDVQRGTFSTSDQQLVEYMRGIASRKHTVAMGVEYTGMQFFEEDDDEIFEEEDDEIC